MMHRIKYSKSLVALGGTVVVSDVGGVVFSSAAMGSRRFFNTGGGEITTKSSSSLVNRDMFQTGDIPNLFRGWQTGGCVSSFVPHQLCNKSRHMLPYFARALTSSSASGSSDQTPRQEPTKRKRDFQLMILEERYDEISSTQCVLLFNHGTNYFEPYYVTVAAAANHHARALAYRSASQSSGQTPRQEPKKKKRECQMIRSSKIQRERCDKISSTEEVSLNQFPGLMVHGMIKNSKTRRLLRMNPDTGYFEEQDVAAAAAAANHDLLPVPNQHVCRGSAYGWLFLIDDNLDMKLLNPFSGTEIQLPPVKTLPPSEKDRERWDLCKWFVYKAFFSANPSIEPRPVVLIIYGGQRTNRLAFCKPGDKGWTPLEFPKFYAFNMDAVYHKGQFYVLGWPGYVVAFDIGRCIDDDDHSVKTVVVATPPKTTVRACNWHLAVLDGELVRFELRSACRRECCNNKEDMEMLERLGKGDDSSTDEEDRCFIDYSDSDLELITPGEERDIQDIVGPFSYESEEIEESEETDREDYPLHPRCRYLNLPSRTFKMKIRRFDVTEKQWVKVKSLGDKAVFLGYNTSFALSASDYPAGVCIPDSVYFNFGIGGNERTEKPFYDMGVYNVKDKTFKPIYPPMHDEGESSYYFDKPAPIWIVNSVDS